jgi:hypothetical protein
MSRQGYVLYQQRFNNYTTPHEEDSYWVVLALWLGRIDGGLRQQQWQ